MGCRSRVSSERELVRLLQVGVVLEEVVEARASQHAQSLSPTGQEISDPALQAVLAEVQDESAEHRTRLEELINQLDADTVPFDHVEQLVQDRYGETRPEGFDDIVYEQFHAEESSYKFYDNLIDAINDSTVEFGVDRDTLLRTLDEIREDEADGAKEVMALIELNL